jgi:hypothetical protein
MAKAMRTMIPLGPGFPGLVLSADQVLMVDVEE